MLTDTLRLLVRKLFNVRAAAMCIASIFAVAGCWMIFAGIKDQGVIDIKTPFITGQARSGFVGVLLTLASVVITVTALLGPAAHGGVNQKIKVRKGNLEIEWEGQLKIWEEAHYVGELLQSIQNSLKEANETPFHSSD